MKKLILSAGILLLVILQVTAQDYKYVPFPTENAIWSEIYYPGGWNEETILERFALNGEDTTINDLVYKKLFLFYDTVFNKNNATYFGGIREDSNKRVYFKCERILHDLKPLTEHNGFDEMILYDFSLNIGDTVNNSKEIINFNWLYYDTLIISNIDTVLIGGKLRKRFQLNYSWVQWIEGIGNLQGLLFTSGDLPFNGLSGKLICFKKNNEVVYLNGSECMPEISAIGDNSLAIEGLNIFPNPANQVIHIFFKDSETGRLTIYDAMGKNVYTFMVPGNSELEIHLPCLDAGNYTIVFINKNKKIYQSKLIIN